MEGKIAAIRIYSTDRSRPFLYRTPSSDASRRLSRQPLRRRGATLFGSVAQWSIFHVISCAFFNNHDEYPVLLPFITDDFECSEKAVHTVKVGKE
jgi:hypothetical protein